MKTNSIILSAFLLICFSVLTCRKDVTETKDSYRLVNTNVPDSEPEIFATDLISKAYRFEQYCSFSPDGKEYYFSVTDSAWGKAFIYKVSLDDPAQQEKISFVKSDYQSGQFIDFTGKKLFFTAIIYSGGLWHTDIYLARKKGNTWDKPEQLEAPVNSYICEWHPTLTTTGVLYFASERFFDHGIADIYKAIPANNRYRKVEKLPEPFNTEYNETDPLIAPDESFLIFASNRPGGVSGADMYNRPNGYDEMDLYICFNKGNDSWTVPKNMGTKVNTDSWEFAPALSPDQKYLFFTRREAFRTRTPSKIYWVSAQIIERLRE